jgi:hypothetical protein
MIPSIALPGLMIPAQFGPTSKVRWSRPNRAEFAHQWTKRLISQLLGFT